MSIQPVTPRVSEAVEAVLSAFETAYLEQQKSNQYPLTLTADQETTLIGAISPHLGNVPTPAKITEILSEVQDLHRLDGRCLEFEGEEYEPEDDGYRYALSDHEENRRSFIRYLIHQQMK
ncbi:hypothetical protein AOZ07_02915 [Glutamicibacter halophytocola]|uniref:hypothetical protein n=1 Tax=Glutamicibacter halophytocola TaxID=1933880 RepID=UPI0006D4BE67|nr:hypothetical protein [Glutamicibacter halophytocola]ALG28051.1 hypothetical protein AOZ07_02915 [Glutamicibacter halophytocola]